MMMSPDPSWIPVSSDSDSDASEPEAESDAESSDTEATPKVAKKYVINPVDKENIQITTIIEFKKAVKRASDDTLADLAKKKRREEKKDKRKREPKYLYLCVECDKPFKEKDGLKKHQESCKKEKAAKRTGKANKDFSCEKCNKSFANKGNLTRHVNSKHNNVATGEKSNPKKYKCKLCKNELSGIYKHYGSKHNIDNVEQLLFDDSTVLVLSDIDTDKGNAPWFKEQLEKAKGRYKGTICRLCESNVGRTDLLIGHYTDIHKVDADSLDIIEHIFRSEMNAHLGETSNPRRADKKVKVTEKKEVNIKGTLQNTNNARIIYKCKCDKATDSYDVAVEHSQDHLVAKYTGTEMNNTRNSSFETNIDGNDVFKIIHFDYDTLLTETWLNMFNNATDKERALSSSIYTYYTSVKLHSADTESTTGIPAYKCDICHFFVHPKKMANHCINHHICATNKPKGHYCEECDGHFYSADALANHKECHDAGLKLVTFNHKNDAQINKVLGNLLECSDEEETEVEIAKNQKKCENGKGTEKTKVEEFCKQCEKWMDASIIASHNAVHQIEKKKHSGATNESGEDPNDVETGDVTNQDGSATREETEPQPHDNHVDNRMHTGDEDPVNDANSKETGIASENDNVSNTGNMVQNESATGEIQPSQDNRDDRMLTEDEDVTMNEVSGKENDVEGTVVVWDSDDSCPGLHSISVQADINMSANENMTAVENVNPPEEVQAMFDADHQSTSSGDAELPCTQELEYLFRSDSSNDHEEPNNATGNNDLLSTQELQQMLESDTVNENNDGRERQQASLDICSDVTPGQNGGFETNNTNNGESEANSDPQDDTVEENVCGDEVKRISVKDVLNQPIPDDDEESDTDDFLKLHALVSMNLSSRD